MKIRTDKDAFGQEIWSYYKGRQSYEIAERDDGYSTRNVGARAYFSSYESWPPRKGQLLHLPGAGSSTSGAVPAVIASISRKEGSM